MRKTKTISLVLITSALAQCSTPNKNNDWNSENSKGNKMYVRSDSTAPYSRTHHNSGSSFLFNYLIFRSIYGMNNGVFGRAGYYSDGINTKSNIGTNSFKGRVSRGGFGRSSRAGS